MVQKKCEQFNDLYRFGADHQLVILTLFLVWSAKFHFFLKNKQNKSQGRNHIRPVRPQSHRNFQIPPPRGSRFCPTITEVAPKISPWLHLWQFFQFEPSFTQLLKRMHPPCFYFWDFFSPWKMLTSFMVGPKLSRAQEWYKVWPSSWL